MNVTVNVLCYRSKRLANGENPLMIRVCKDGKKKYLGLGLSVNPDYWDFEKNKPKINCPNREEIQQIILERTKEYQEQILDYKVTNKEFTATSLVEKVNSPIVWRLGEGGGSNVRTGDKLAKLHNFFCEAHHTFAKPLVGGCAFLLLALFLFDFIFSSFVFSFNK